jgi:hypothetical protein
VPFEISNPSSNTAAVQYACVHAQRLKIDSHPCRLPNPTKGNFSLIAVKLVDCTILVGMNARKCRCDIGGVGMKRYK